MKLSKLFNIDYFKRKKSLIFSSGEMFDKLSSLDCSKYESAFLREHIIDINKICHALNMNVSLKTPHRYGCDDLIYFSKNHGFTLRFFRNDRKHEEVDVDFFRRMHGVMVAPIGWGNIEGLSFYLYAGEQLMENDETLFQSWDKNGDLYDKYFAPETKNGYRIWDYGTRNLGVIVNGKEKLPILIDTDCLKADDVAIDKNRQHFNSLVAEGLTPGRAYEEVTIHNSKGSVYEWTALRHQDLRRAFFDAWPGAHHGNMDVDPDKMDHFLQLCKSKVEKPRYVQKHYTTSYVNDNGVTINRVRTSPAEYEQLHPSWKKRTKAMSKYICAK